MFVYVEIKREGVFTDADGFAKVIHYWNFQSVWFCSESCSPESNLPMKVSAKFSVSTHIQMCVLQSMSRLADQKRSWYLSIVKMTKYLSLVQQNINAISQLKKENEYHSVWTGCIGLVNKSFFEILKCRSYNFIVKVIWPASMGDVFRCVFQNSVL